MSAPALAARLRRLSRDTGSLDRRHLFEIAAVLHRRKSLVRVLVPRDRMEPCLRGLEALGLAVARPQRGLAVIRETPLGDRYTEVAPLDDPRVAEVALHAAYDLDVAELGREADEGADARTIGQRLGYPECCVDAYEGVSEARDWVDILLDGTPEDAALDPLGNKLAYLFDGDSLLPDYFPCSLACAEARALAAAHRFAALESGLAEEVSGVEAALARPILVWGGLVIQVDGASRGAGGALRFDPARARLHAWRTPVGTGLPAEARAAVAGSDGVTLLDAALRPLPGTRDAGGRLLRFEGRPG